MKKFSAFVCLSLICICLSVSAQDFKTVRDGIEYARITRGTGDEPVRVNLLKLDLTKVRLDVAHAKDTAVGLEKTSSIALRCGALAAINAGFFRLDKSVFAGDATGVLVINNRLYSESYGGRVALLIDNGLKRSWVSIERTNITDVVGVGDREFETGRNRERRSDDLVLFSNDFNQTTLTGDDGIEFFIENGKVVKIVEQKGSGEIPASGYILSASGKWREELKALIQPGMRVTYYVRQISSSASSAGTLFATAEDIIGGAPQLIKNGKVEITWQEEKASRDLVEKRHPRTAAAKLRDGKFLLVTVDGRQAGWSVGMTLPELAALLLELGAQEAMNLDGGGSTTMFLDGKIVNKPSDKEGERAVGDALLVFPRK